MARRRVSAPPRVSVVSLISAIPRIGAPHSEQRSGSTS